MICLQLSSDQKFPRSPAGQAGCLFTWRRCQSGPPRWIVAGARPCLLQGSERQECKRNDGVQWWCADGECDLGEEHSPVAQDAAATPREGLWIVRVKHPQPLPSPAADMHAHGDPDPVIAMRATRQLPNIQLRSPTAKPTTLTVMDVSLQPDSRRCLADREGYESLQHTCFCISEHQQSF